MKAAPLLKPSALPLVARCVRSPELTNVVTEGLNTRQNTIKAPRRMSVGAIFKVWLSNPEMSSERLENRKLYFTTRQLEVDEFFLSSPPAGSAALC